MASQSSRPTYAALAGRRRRLGLAVLLLALVGAAILGSRLWRIAAGLRDLQATTASIEQTMSTAPDIATLVQLGPQLRHARATLADLRREAAPLIPLAALLDRAPRIGGDLAAAGPLLDYGYHLAVAADETHTALAPLAATAGQGVGAHGALVAQLAAGRPGLEAAQRSLDAAAAARQRLDLGRLSEPVSARVDRVEHLLPEARDALDLARQLPGLLGADGPRAYLLLGQNPDELRATGGLITTAGVLTLDGGQIAELALQDSAAVDAPDRGGYPAAPEPIQRYMGADRFLIRDASWSPDFPTAARTALELYRLGSGRELGSVIAFDMHALGLLLEVLGAVTVEGVPYPVTPANLETELRTPYGMDHDLGREEFKRLLADALLDRIAGDAGSIELAALARAAQRALDERHILIYSEDPDAAALLARHGWDGAVRPGDADFVMVVDANVGYNKASANIRQSLDYAIDLLDPAAPRATLTVRHEHLVPGPRPCIQLGEVVPAGQSKYASWLERCYWTYLRVLAPAGSELIASRSQPTPAEWLMSGVADDGAVVPVAVAGGPAAFGVLVVVPTGETRETAFSYRLPEAVVLRDGATWRYRLRLQKQPGTRGAPVTITMRLPAGAELLASSIEPVRRGGGLLSFTLTLDRDRELEVQLAMQGGDQRGPGPSQTARATPSPGRL